MNDRPPVGGYSAFDTPPTTFVAGGFRAQTALAGKGEWEARLLVTPSCKTKRADVTCEVRREEWALAQRGMTSDNCEFDSQGRMVRGRSEGGVSNAIAVKMVVVRAEIASVNLKLGATKLSLT